MGHKMGNKMGHKMGNKIGNKARKCICNKLFIKINKQIIRCVLAFALVLGLVPGMPLQARVEGADSKTELQPDASWYVESEASSTNTYYIYTAEQLAGLAQLVNNEQGPVSFAGKTIFLTRDIDLGNYSNSWEPIGYNAAYSFQGIFSGQGHTIKNLRIDLTGENNSIKYIGLFGHIKTTNTSNKASLLNITLLDVHIEVNYQTIGSYYIGGICGYNDGGQISYCAVSTGSTGSIKGTTLGAVGGIVGRNEGTVNYCFNDGVHVTGIGLQPSETESGQMGSVGGICGLSTSGDSLTQNAAKLEYCYNTGNVAATSQYVGGIYGCIGQKGSIDKCYNTGDVTLTVKTGTSDKYIGGICGLMVVKTGVADGKITNAYWYSTNTNALTLYVGTSTDPTLVENLAISNIQTVDATKWSVKYLTVDELKSLVSNIIFNESTRWKCYTGINQDYPVLKYFYETEPYITQSPTDKTVSTGDNAVFCASATAYPAATYQWQVSTGDNQTWNNITNGGKYTGANTDILTLTNVTENEDGYLFKCVIQNSIGSVKTTDYATLTVNATAISLEPSSDILFSSVIVGYASPPSPETVTINNTGNSATGELTIGLTGANSDAFTLSSTTVTDIVKGGSATFTVAPKPALVKGTYTATVTVSGADISPKSFDVSFSVNDLPDTSVTIKQIAGVAPPKQGETPVKEITPTDQFTGTVAWSPAHEQFAFDTVYTATITLTPKTTADTAYTLTGVTADFFTVAGAESVTNKADSGVITAKFPATALELVKSIAIKTSPNKVTYVAGELLDLTGLVVSLEKDSGKVDVAFADFEANHITTSPANRASLSESDTAVTIIYSPDSKTASQPITVNPPPITVTALEIKTPPTLTSYQAGDKLDLTGLVVTVLRSDDSEEDVVLADFEDKGITTDPENGAVLKGNTKVVTITITSGKKSVQQDITVEPLPVEITAMDIKTPPKKTAYYIGEPLDLKGLVVTLNKNDDTAEDVAFADFADYDITTDPANGTELTEADTLFTVMYQTDDITATQAITVNPPPVTVSAVTVQTPPTRTDYMTGDTLDLAGLVVTLTKSDESSVDVAFDDFTANDITTDPAHGAELSDAYTAVTITYAPDKKSVSQPITVEPLPVTVVSITIKNKPDKTTYLARNTLDLTGLVVRMIKSDESIEDVAFEDFAAKGITANPAHGAILTHTDTAVTISCENGAKSVKQAIIVNRSTINDVTVGAQEGTLTAGRSGTVTFPVTTTNKSDGAYFVTVTNLPTGMSVRGQLNLKDNSGTLTLSGNAFITAGTTSNLVLVLDGVSSNTFTLTVSGTGGTGGTGGTPSASTHRLTLRARTGGSIVRGATGQYDAGELVSIEVDMEDGYVFDRWESTNGGEFGDEYNPATTFTMPAADTTVTAYFYFDVYSAQQSANIPAPAPVPTPVPTPTPTPPSTPAIPDETASLPATPSPEGGTGTNSQGAAGAGSGAASGNQSTVPGRINATVNGKAVTLDSQPPTTVNNVLYVPLREIFDALGFAVRWNQATQTATFYNGIYTVNLRVGGSSFTTVLYGKTTAYTINPPVMLINGKMMISLESLRTVQLSIGNQSAWDNNQNNLTITGDLGFTMLPTP